MNDSTEQQVLEGEISLSDIWNTVQRRFLLIILVLVVFIAGSILHLQNITETFQSTVVLLIQSPNNSMQNIGYMDYYASEQWTQTYAEMIKGDPVTKETAKRIPYPKFSASKIQDGLTVEAVRNTLLLKISFTYTQGIYAKKVVDTISEVFIEKTSELYESNIKASTKKLERNIQDIESQIETIQKALSENILTQSEITLKQNKLKGLYDLKSILDENLQRQIIAEQQLIPSVKVYQEGTLPTSASNKKVNLTVSIAGVLGLFVGLLLAFLLEYLDDTIKTEEDIKKITNQRVLGIIPRFGQKAENSYYSPYSTGYGKYNKKPG